MKLALGPLLYYWSREKTFDFYKLVESMPVDIVYLGETVCSRRHELRLADWLHIANALSDAGKTPVLSTQVLIESGSDVTTLRKIVENSKYLVEANDFGAVHRLENALPFIGGPHLNIYNIPTLELMASLGMKRWTIPLEMGMAELVEIQKGRPKNIETEVFVYGRMPLAFSARCFTARYRNLPKDDCQFSCIDYPDGLLMHTREDQGFLVLNGTQTQSAKVCNLIRELKLMKNIGVDVVRLSPQSINTGDIVQLFRQTLNEQISADSAMDAIAELMPDQPCNGYWYGKPGLEHIVATEFS